jgi:hypothetical protein
MKVLVTGAKGQLLSSEYNYMFYNFSSDYFEPVFGLLNKYTQVIAI